MDRAPAKHAPLGVLPLFVRMPSLKFVEGCKFWLGTGKGGVVVVLGMERIGRERERARSGIGRVLMAERICCVQPGGR